MLAQQQAADDKKNDDSRAADSKKKLDAEKFLEQKQEQKLLKPAVKVAENTKSVFQRLFDALTGIFAGWLFQFLTAPESRPLMMYFWKNRAKITGGITASTPAAMMVT